MQLLRLAVPLALLLFPLFAQDRPRIREEDASQAERQEWFYEQRRYPLGHIPTGARIDAVESTKRLERQIGIQRTSGITGGRAASKDPQNWAMVGPQPTDKGTTYPTAGRVNAIAIDPRDNNTVYIGAAEGGVWKTTDGGVNWKPLTDDQPSLANGAIALDPANPDIVYVGTGEENFAADSYYGAGFLKSTDGGATWTNIVGPFLRARIGAVAIHPSNSQILLCSTDAGVWRSTDSAATWTKVLGTVAGTSVVFDPTNGNIAYAALGATSGNTQNGVYRSTDAGATWKQLTGDGANAFPSKAVGRISIALAPSTPTTLYVAIGATPVSAGFLGMWKTTDSGVTWNQLSTVPTSFCALQCWYDMTLAVHPKNPDIVWGGGFALHRTLDGGNTWQTFPPVGPSGTELHVDQHFLAFTPDGGKLYIANDGGMYSTTSIDTRTASWTALNDTLSITQFYPGLSVSPVDPDFLAGGTQDNGTQLYSGKLSWSNVTCGDGGWTAIDSTLPSIFYGACQNISIRKTRDGTNFLATAYGIGADRTQFISPFVADSANPQTLYFGTYRLWQSVDGAGRWQAMSPDLTSGSPATIKAIAVAPSDSNRVYVGTNDSRIEVTANASAGTLANWARRDVGLPSRTITHIAVDPVDPMTAYVTFSGFALATDTLGHIFKTQDGGAAWTDISGDLPNIPVNDLVVDPDVPGTLYAATDAGVVVSTRSGGNWTTLGYGLPRVVVSSLSLQRSARVMRAATHGRSVWEIGVLLGSPSIQPVIRSLSPIQSDAGAPGFTLNVSGMNFGSGSIVRWNGQDRPTTVVDATHLSALIPAADISKLGRATVAVLNPSAGGGVSNAVNFNIGGAPVTKPEAFVNAANAAGGNALAPRSIATLYGVNFSGQTSVADVAPPLPFTLAGVDLVLAGNPVPLFFVSPGQINFQVPFDTIKSPAKFPLIVTQGNQSTTIQVTLQPQAPALFTTNSQGTGQASALIASTGSIPAPAGAFPGSRPVKKGEYVSLYGTGLGDVRNRPLLGSPSPSSPLASTLVNPTVSIGGVAATVSFSGLAPDFVGLYQVNVQVPNGAPSGSAIPVILTIGGIVSNTATIAVE